MPIVRTSEAVCVGHPDKLCDLIADRVLDDILWEDKTARVAVEVLAAGRTITVAGEITTSVRPRIRDSVRQALIKAGYEPCWFRIRVRVRRQSPDISAGVTTSLEARAGDESAFALQGAGDQGTVYGYATSETKEMLPLPLVLAHDICRRLDKARDRLDYFRRSKRLVMRAPRRAKHGKFPPQQRARHAREAQLEPICRDRWRILERGGVDAGHD